MSAAGPGGQVPAERPSRSQAPAEPAAGRPPRIGLYGGAFNPPHLAHLALARAARDQLDLDRVLLVPAARPPHKTVDDDPGPEVRLDLVRTLVAGEPGLEASDLELRRDGPSYTVQTLRELRELEPDATLVLVLGADAAASLPTWHQPEDVVALAELGVAARPGTDRDAVHEAVAALGPQARLRWFHWEPTTLSSTEVRGRAAAGRPVAQLTGPAVARRLATLGLHPPPTDPAAAPTTVRHVPAAPQTTDRAPAGGPVEHPGPLPSDQSPSTTAGPADPHAPDTAELTALVRALAEAAAERKAGDLEAIDLRGASGFTDAFLLCTGNTDRQVKAIHDVILEVMRRDHGRRPRAVEGLPEARWVLMDYGDAVVHVQVPEARDYYRLGRLWGDRPRLDLGAAPEA